MKVYYKDWELFDQPDNTIDVYEREIAHTRKLLKQESSQVSRIHMRARIIKLKELIRKENDKIERSKEV